MTLTFAVSGILIVIFSAGFRFGLPSSRLTTIAIWLLILAGIGMIGLISPTDKTMDRPLRTWHGILHDSSFVVIGLTLMPAMVLLGFVVLKDERWRDLAVYTWLTVALAVPTFCTKRFAFYVFLLAFRLMLVAREDSPFRAPQDLIGRSFALGDESAYLQRAVLLHAGLRLEQFKTYKYLGHYDNIARGVANGDFDAGILKDTTAYQWEKRGLRIIHASPELPPYNIAVSGRVDEGLARDIQAALLRLNPANPEHARIVRALEESYDGFVAATDADYAFIRAMVQPFLK